MTDERVPARPEPAGPDAPPLRTGWRQARMEHVPDRAEIAALVQAVVPRARVLDVEPLSGGLSNINLRVDLDRPPARLLLRLYQRDPLQAGKECALATPLRAHGVPVAQPLHLAAPDGSGTRVALFEWIEGQRLDRLAARLDPPALHRVAVGVGGALAATHAIRFATLGFLDAGLQVEHAIALDGPALLGFLDERLLRQGGAGHLGEALAAEVIAHATREAGRLAEWSSLPCLVHADCNPSNLLVGPGGALAALLDWEFALSAIPAIDFATLLRPGMADRPEFTAGLAEGYRAGGGWLPPDWEAIARLADLFAWADMLSRPDADLAMARDAARVMRRLLA